MGFAPYPVTLPRPVFSNPRVTLLTPLTSYQTYLMCCSEHFVFTGLILELDSVALSLSKSCARLRVEFGETFPFCMKSSSNIVIKTPTRWYFQNDRLSRFPLRYLALRIEPDVNHNFSDCLPVQMHNDVIIQSFEDFFAVSPNKLLKNCGLACDLRRHGFLGQLAVT